MNDERCLACSQENCGYGKCYCSCHGVTVSKETEEDKKNTDILKRASKIMEKSKLKDEDWYIFGGATGVNVAGNGEGHWATVCIFVPKK